MPGLTQFGTRLASGIPSGAITVGSGGKYSTLSAALQDTSRQVLRLPHHSQVAISRSNIKIYGETSDSSSYTGNKVTLTDNVPASSAGSNDASGTVRILATGVKLYNLNIANTYGKPVDQSQAIALSVQAGQFGCYGCQISLPLKTFIESAKGDTRLAVNLTVVRYLARLPPSGSPRALFRRSDDANYYVINSSTIQGTHILGRLSMKADLGGTMPVSSSKTRKCSPRVQMNVSDAKAAGWSVWSSSDTRTDHVTFGESGAWNSARPSFATQLSSAVSISTVLGSSYTSWVDTTYL
ncbi:4582_t:CDS:2 [Acaulospora colombiana]|uniref:4582_t:CDS:1 n=1 Tax=Acaulospora colombiana TaxID=27376 RepID=A0ACA9NLP3_9GLOM|nr:4582_t:CDS:2 [Acaulospora colombiana]